MSSSSTTAAANILAEEFPGLPVWVTDDAAIDLEESNNFVYMASRVSSSSLRSSVGSQEGIATDSPGTTQLMYSTSNCLSGNVDSPADTVYGYQLPSPMEDEIVLDPVSIDKERRREQNRVAQRAFRERKESKLKHLEKKIADLQADNKILERKYHNLRTAHLRLQSGLRVLLHGSGTFDDFDPDTCRSQSNSKD